MDRIDASNSVSPPHQPPSGQATQLSFIKPLHQGYTCIRRNSWIGKLHPLLVLIGSSGAPITQMGPRWCELNATQCSTPRLQLPGCFSYWLLGTKSFGHPYHPAYHGSHSSPSLSAPLSSLWPSSSRHCLATHPCVRLGNSVLDDNKTLLDLSFASSLRNVPLCSRLTEQQLSKHLDIIHYYRQCPTTADPTISQDWSLLCPWVVWVACQ